MNETTGLSVAKNQKKVASPRLGEETLVGRVGSMQDKEEAVGFGQLEVVTVVSVAWWGQMPT